MTYDNTNKGVLFINDKKGKETAPDRRGSINIGGTDFWLSGWTKQDKNGNPFLSLSVQAKEAQQRETAKQTADVDDTDIIPF